MCMNWWNVIYTIVNSERFPYIGSVLGITHFQLVWPLLNIFRLFKPQNWHARENNLVCQTFFGRRDTITAAPPVGCNPNFWAHIVWKRKYSKCKMHKILKDKNKQTNKQKRKMAKPDKCILNQIILNDSLLLLHFWYPRKNLGQCHSFSLIKAHCEK